MNTCKRERISNQLIRKHKRWWIRAVLGFLFLWNFPALSHPASGIVVTEKEVVFFIHTGKGIARIDRDGTLTYIHKVTGGGHFLARDPDGKFSNQLPRLFEKVLVDGPKPTLLYASGGAPFVVVDGNLYYGSGYPEGDDLTPGGLTLTRLSLDGNRTLFSPELKSTLARLGEAICGLAAGPNGTLFVACPNAILKVKTNGTVETLLHPVEVKDCDDVFGKFPDAPFFHAPYLRGLDVTEDETVYAAVTGCRSVIKIDRRGKIETILKSEKPWTPTGVTVRGRNVFVLEYTHDEKPENWVPRVRKLAPDGKITLLADPAKKTVQPSP